MAKHTLASVMAISREADRLTAHITLDYATDHFRARPGITSGKLYCRIATEYWLDGMIGEDSLLFCLREVRDEIGVKP